MSGKIHSRRKGKNRHTASPGRSAPNALSPAGRLIMGRNTIRELLHSQPQRLLTLYAAHGDQRAESIQKEARRHNIKVELLDTASLSRLVNSDNHQGVVASLAPAPVLSLKEILTRVSRQETILFLILDSIVDPQNLGTLLRAAECFAVDAVLVSSNRGSPITPVVAKASVGASELVPILIMSNLADAVRKLKEAGIWIVAAEGAEDSEAITDFKFPRQCAILLGSEGTGLHALLKKESDFQVKIPLLGSISSLNVSQACAIFLHSFRASLAAQATQPS